ncbi:MAG: hypothetical protein H0W88_11870 [Parachlamydiaceae bacterium]|nr:hypothetical protein [Parachlamydiaceae bacterium]
MSHISLGIKASDYEKMQEQEELRSTKTKVAVANACCTLVTAVASVVFFSIAHGDSGKIAGGVICAVVSVGSCIWQCCNDTYRSNIV